MVISSRTEALTCERLTCWTVGGITVIVFIEIGFAFCDVYL
jgi:hypothetical protein